MSIQVCFAGAENINDLEGKVGPQVRGTPLVSL